MRRLILTSRNWRSSFGLSKLGIAVASVVTLLVLLLLGAYFYIHSNAFRQSLEDRLSVALGVPVELSGELRVQSLLPKISMLVSGAKLQTAEISVDVTRARLQKLQLSVSPGVVFSGGVSGSINLELDSLSIISDSSNADSIADTFQALLPPLSEPPIAGLVAELLNEISGLDIHANIKELAVFIRDEGAGNSAYQFADVDLAVSDSDIRASADLLEDELVTQSLSLTISHAVKLRENVDWQVVGTLDVGALASTDKYQSHKLSGEWQIQNSQLTLEALEYKSDQAWLRGDATVAYSAPSISIDSDLELRQFDLNGGAFGPPEPAVVPSSGRMFSFDNFHEHLPNYVSADIRLYLGAIRLYGAPVANGQLKLLLEDGVVEVSSEELHILGGAADLSLEFDNSLSQLVGFKMKLEASDMQLERIQSSDDDDSVLSRGKANFIVAMRGVGPSLAHIASSLNGYVIAGISNAEIKQRYSTLIDIGVVSWAMKKISAMSGSSKDKRPSAKLSDPLPIECASLRVYINDGRVEVSNGAIVETRSNVLFTSGYVDLQSENLGFVFRTKSRSLFDLSAISIAKYAEVGGSLKNPKLSLNAKELAKQGVLSASSAAWGPLPSLVYSLAESGLKNSQAMECTPDIG